MPAVQLTTHVKSSTLYSRTVVRSYGRTVVRSYGRTVVRSYGRTVVRSYGRTVLRSYGLTVLRSYGLTVLRLYGRTSKFFRLDGLLLFCIIMGLRSASSAIKLVDGYLRCK